MEFNIFSSTAFLIATFSLIALVVGVFFGRSIGRSQLSADIAELKGEKLVLEEKLSGQQAHFETQLKLVQDAKANLSQEFENLANRIFEDKQNKFSEQSKQALETSLSPLRRDLGDFRKQVSSAYEKENADRNRLAGQISELQKQTMKISSEAASLASALKGDNKQQGNWGEFVLEKLLEDSGLSKGREYETQVALKDEEGKRRNPDVIIRLPEGKDIIIDAKTSLLNYERYFHAQDEQERQEFLKNHLNSLRAHIKGLDIKNYEKLETVNSLDFVLIFIPVESAFMLALDNDPDIMREAYDRGIILVSPSTLMVTLRTIKNLWRYADQNINAQQIAEKAGALYDHFVLHVEALEDIGKHLDRGKDAYDTALKRLSTGRGNLVKRSEELKTLGAKTKKAIADKLLPSGDA
ncbi:MAG: DNA recombination protein RmuC [Porticoccaceae bacterium]|jgi:DNA recombination protein RmuC